MECILRFFGARISRRSAFGREYGADDASESNEEWLVARQAGADDTQGQVRHESRSVCAHRLGSVVSSHVQAMMKGLLTCEVC